MLVGSDNQGNHGSRDVTVLGRVHTAGEAPSVLSREFSQPATSAGSVGSPTAGARTKTENQYSHLPAIHSTSDTETADHDGNRQGRAASSVTAKLGSHPTNSNSSNKLPTSESPEVRRGAGGPRALRQPKQPKRRFRGSQSFATLPGTRSSVSDLPAAHSSAATAATKASLRTTPGVRSSMEDLTGGLTSSALKAIEEMGQSPLEDFPSDERIKYLDWHRRGSDYDPQTHRIRTKMQEMYTRGSSFSNQPQGNGGKNGKQLTHLSLTNSRTESAAEVSDSDHHDGKAKRRVPGRVPLLASVKFAAAPHPELEQSPLLKRAARLCQSKVKLEQQLINIMQKGSKATLRPLSAFVTFEEPQLVYKALQVRPGPLQGL